MKFFIYAALLVGASAQVPCDTFTCDATDLSKVSIITAAGPANVNCPVGQKCNFRSLPPCAPCIPDNCADVFTCVSDTQVQIGSVTVNCDIDYVCNRNAMEPCSKPCVPKGACEGGFSCIDTTTYFNEQTNTQEKCLAGTVCNKDLVPPCTPCINIATTTTTQKPFATPNCNDGGGSMRQCREGPVGWYYKCMKSGGFLSSYQAIKLPCDNVASDLVCRNAWVCIY